MKLLGSDYPYLKARVNSILKKWKIEWANALFISGYHLALLIGLPFYFIYQKPSLGLCLYSAILVYLTGLGITLGYHRLYAHPTYKVNKAIEALILFFATMATQGSALQWAHDHRNHHAYVDTDRDPYCIKKGFMYAHLFWLFKKLPPMDKKKVADLWRNKLVAFQHRFYLPLLVITNVLVTLLVGFLLSDYLGAFVLAWGVRLFALHHLTWCINSLAHFWGAQSFSQEHSAVDNYCISLLTFGEGYHNYHHTYANDYRNGVKWYHFDPTKWIIWILSRCRLASGLRRVNSFQIKERIVIESKKEIRRFWRGNAQPLFAKVDTFTEILCNKIAEIRRLSREHHTFGKKGSNLEKSRELSLKIKQLKKGLKADLSKLRKFVKAVIRMRPGSKTFRSIEFEKQIEMLTPS